VRVLQVADTDPGSVERSVVGWLIVRCSQLDHQAATLARGLMSHRPSTV
jgi:hypothetical protein